MERIVTVQEYSPSPSSPTPPSTRPPLEEPACSSPSPLLHTVLRREGSGGWGEGSYLTSGELARQGSVTVLPFFTRYSGWRGHGDYWKYSQYCWTQSGG